MSLRHQQDLLARLYTEPEYRTRFLRRPSDLAEDAGVSAEQAEALATVAAAEVQWFADSLVNKRLREVAKLLPLTEQEMGSKEFERRFRAFSAGFSPTSTKKHLEDALAFADGLERDQLGGGEVRNVVRFESRRLRHNASERRFSFCLLDRDPHDMTHGSRKGRGLWIAIGGWSRIFFRPGRRGPRN